VVCVAWCVWELLNCKLRYHKLSYSSYDTAYFAGTCTCWCTETRKAEENARYLEMEMKMKEQVRVCVVVGGCGVAWCCCPVLVQEQVLKQQREAQAQHLKQDMYLAGKACPCGAAVVVQVLVPVRCRAVQWLCEGAVLIRLMLLIMLEIFIMITYWLYW